jgi:ATP-binding cassette, subfamily C, bacterial exporter for protease/lipase
MNALSFFLRSRLSAILLSFRREFAVCVIFTVVVNVLMLTPTIYMLQVYDRVLVSGSEFTLAALTLVMLYFFAVMAFAEWARSRLLVRTGVKLDEELNSVVFNASFESCLNHDGRNPAQAFSDLTNVRQFLTSYGLFAFLDAPWSPIYIFVLYLLHPWLGLLSVCFALMLLGVAYLSHRLTFEPIDRALDAGRQANSYLRSKLRNAEVIESMGMLGDLRRHWQSRHRRYLGLNHKAQEMTSRLQALTKFLRYTQQSLALGAGALLVIRGELSPGAMIAANVLMGRATAPIDLLVSTWKSSISALKSFLRLEELLERYPQRRSGMVHDEPKGQLQIENLVATTPTRAQPILKGLTATFPANAIVAIIGPSGSGKSTLARALIGIWPHIEGKVLIDGEPIQGWDRDELGPFIGYLPQDIELFEGTIAENIARFGEIDSEKVILAASRAGIHDMILRFPQGYDTRIGDAGNLLSGGQRQRIGLARAMYGDPCLIVLDEPNSNLDDAGESALVTAVQELKRNGKTLLIITHRMSIVGITDFMLVLREGAIQIYGPSRSVITELQHNPAGQGNADDHETPEPQPV